MQISQHNSYNSLGRLGPHYERPEYRPPERNQDLPEAAVRGDRRTLSTKNTDAPLKKAAAPLPTGRLNLSSAHELTEATALLIQNLRPESTNQEPHQWLRSSLLSPVYA